MPLRLTSRVKSKSVLPIFDLVSWDIEVASVIKLSERSGASYKFVYFLLLTFINDTVLRPINVDSKDKY